MATASSSAAPVMRPGPRDLRVALSVRRRKSWNLDFIIGPAQMGTARPTIQNGQRAGWGKFLEGLFMVGAECSTVFPAR